MQIMDIARDSFPKGLVFSARMILGVAVAAGSVALGIWISGEAIREIYFAFAIVGGFASGCILRVHLFWAIPLVFATFLATIFITGDPTTGDDDAEMIIRLAIGLMFAPVFAASFAGLLVSTIYGGRQTHSQ